MFLYKNKIKYLWGTYSEFQKCLQQSIHYYVEQKPMLETGNQPAVMESLG